MTRLHPDESCGKCGGTALDYQWRVSTQPPPRYYYHSPASLLEPTRAEVIRLTCRRCGAAWERAPLDALDEP